MNKKQNTQLNKRLSRAGSSEKSWQYMASSSDRSR
jgi:hypothetical protein